MRPCSVPRPGDVVVKHGHVRGVDVYLLRATPAADQYHVPSRKEAVTHATMYSREHGVRAWLEEGPAFSLIASSRVIHADIQERHLPRAAGMRR
jgi:hypothetical protein